MLEIEKEKNFSGLNRFTLSGIIYNSVGDYENAIKNFRLAIRGRYNVGYSLTSMGYALYQLGKYDSATICFEKMRKSANSKISPNDSVQ